MVLILILGVNVSASLACSCADDPDATLADKLKWAAKGADAIFVGKVERFDFIKDVPNEFLEKRRDSIPGLTWETKTVVFDVNRFWKGIEGSVVSIFTEQTRNSDGTASTSSCEYGFDEGKTYLVFARNIGGHLRNLPCSFTRRDDQIDQILPLLGEGKKPTKPDPQNN